MQLAILLTLFTLAQSIRVPTAWPPLDGPELGRDSYTPDDSYTPLITKHASRLQADVNTRRNNKLNYDGGHEQQIHHGGKDDDSRHDDPKMQQVKDTGGLLADGWVPMFDPLKVLENPYPKFGANFETESKQFETGYQKPSFKLNDDIPFEKISDFLDIKHPTFDDQYREVRAQDPKHFDQYANKEKYFEKNSHLIKDRSSDDYVSDHESPKYIPTSPFYPGEGLWAKPGLKHTPYVSDQKYTTLEDDHGPEPEGYDTFRQGQMEFDRQKADYKASFDGLPENNYESEYDTKKALLDLSFIPTRMYAQVRKTEGVKHLTQDPNESRLREVIKDSKIHTVYTEEGYEDLAYDHAGHEKNAEKHEGDYDLEKKQNYKTRPSRKIESDNKPSASETENAKPDVSKTKTKKPSKTVVRKRKLSKVKEVKTVSMKNMGDGDTQLEILSETKVITNPNNKSTTHKYVKIAPIEENSVNNKIADNPTTILPTTTTTTTTKPTKSIKKRSIDNSFLILLTRRKRYTNDFPKLDVDTSVIDEIKDIPTPKKIPVPNKYPYYKSRDLNENSPLRYAEDLRNIPQKRLGNMAFYDQAAKECEDVQSDVNPIPERVKNKAETSDDDEKEENDEAEQPQTPDLPRLRNLGDKIDCFKEKYFGENPLDSPIFQEEVIQPPQSIFKDKQLNSDLSNGVFKIGNQPIVSASEARETVQFLPGDSKPSIENSTDFVTSAAPITQSLTTNNKPNSSSNVNPEQRNVHVSFVTKDERDIRNSRSLLIEDDTGTTESEGSSTDSLPQAEELRRRRRKRPKRPLGSDFNAVPKPTYSTDNLHTNYFPPKYKTISEVHYKDEIQPEEQLNVFSDIFNNIKNSSRYDPLQVEASENFEITTMPNDKSINIRLPHRKIRIKPSKNNHKFEEEEEDDAGGTATSYFHITHHNYRPNKNKLESNSVYDGTSTSKPGRVRIGTRDKSKDKIKNINEWYELAQESDHVYHVSPHKEKKRKRKPGSLSRPEIVEQASEVEEIVVEDPTADVVGLVPPIQGSYQTILIEDELDPMVVIEKNSQLKMNHFYVKGMKPPPVQHIIDYGDYNLVQPQRFRRRNFNHRSKRSPNRPGYSEIRRNKTPTTTEKAAEEDDDYVPHRNRNFHYDPDTGKIIYDKAQNYGPEEEEIVVSEEVEEVKSTTASTPKAFNIRDILERTTRNPNEPTILDFINKLKSAENYKFIPQPDPKMKQEMETAASSPKIEQMQSTTSKPISTTVPAFLQILSKVKSDTKYHFIEMEKPKVTTSAPAEVIEEIVEEETLPPNVKNSPGFSSRSDIMGAVDVSDDSETGVKNYSPRTSINYSKYKTIDRGSSRARFSSKIDMDDSTSAESIEVAMPVVMPQTEDPPKQIEDSFFSTEEAIESTTTSTTTTTTEKSAQSSNRRRFRGRTRASITTKKPDTQSPTTRRVIARRQRTRTKSSTESTTPILVQSTTTTTTTTTQKPKRRRSQSQPAAQEVIVPSNHKSVYTPIAGIDPIGLVSEENKNIATSLVNKNRDKTEGEKGADNTEINPKANIEVFHKYNRNKKHGGNYRKENEETKDQFLSSTIEAGNPESSTTTENQSFLSPFDVEVAVVREVPKTFDFTIEDRIDKDIFSENAQAEDEEKSTTTKKPVFIKDPSKRLYFYAPI